MTLTAIVGALMALVASPKRLERSQARLVDRIERLERELALTQEVLAHWRDEAARLARENRDRREMAQHQAQVDTLAIYGPRWQAQQAQQMQNFQGFCNCVPSRAQVWGAQHGLVQQLNDNTVKE